MKLTNYALLFGAAVSTLTGCRTAPTEPKVTLPEPIAHYQLGSDVQQRVDNLAAVQVGSLTMKLEGDKFLYFGDLSVPPLAIGPFEDSLVRVVLNADIDGDGKLTLDEVVGEERRVFAALPTPEISRDAYRDILDVYKFDPTDQRIRRVVSALAGIYAGQRTVTDIGDGGFRTDATETFTPLTRSNAPLILLEDIDTDGDHEITRAESEAALKKILPIFAKRRLN